MLFTQNPKWHYAAVFIIAALLYINTLGHGFVLDDEVVITENSFVKRGIEGIPGIFSHDSFAGYARVGERAEVVEGGRYRPLSLFFFAVIYQLTGPDPFVFHLFSILLYALSGIVLLWMLRLLLKDRAYGILIALVVTVLFIVHPVHTEVVANVKSCDEQLALLFGMLSCIYFLKGRDEKRSIWFLFSGVLLLLAFFGKENSIVWMIMIPLAVFFFRQARFGHLLKTSLYLIIPALLFLFIRHFVTGDNMQINAPDPLNNPFLSWNGNEWISITGMEKAATLFYIFANYIRLLFFPFPLTHDYYPDHISIQDFTRPLVWIGLLLFVAVTTLVITGIKRKGIISFGALFFLASLVIVSNLFFPVGTFMAERFLYLPSLGFCLAMAVMPVHYFKERDWKFLAFIFYMIVLIFAILTILRNNAWRDNETLLRTDVKISGQSIKLNNDLGTVLLMKALQTTDVKERESLLQESNMHLKFAVDHHPTYYDALLAYGANAFYVQQYEESVQSYRRAYVMNPRDPKSRTGLIYALQGHGINLGQQGKAEQGIIVLNEAWLLQPDTLSAIEVANYYHVLDQQHKSIEWLEKAAQLAPGSRSLQERILKAKQTEVK